MIGWFGKDERRWFIVLAVIAVLEAINIGLLTQVYPIVSLIITVFILLFACYVFALFYQFLKEKGRNSIHYHHATLINELKSVTKRIENTEKSLFKQTEEKFVQLKDELKKMDENLSHQVIQLSETLTEKITTTEQNIKQLHLDSKEQLLKQTKTNFTSLSDEVKTIHHTQTNQLQNVTSQLQENLTEQHENIIALFGQKESALHTLINDETVKTRTVLHEAEAQITATLNQLQRHHENAMVDANERATSNHNTLLNTLKKQLNEASNRLTTVNNDVAERLTFTSENILKTLAKSEAHIAEKITLEGKDKKVYLDKLYEHLNQVSGKLKEKVIQLNEEVLAKTTNDSLSVVEHFNERLNADGAKWNDEFEKSAETLGNISKLMSEKTKEQANLFATTIGQTKQALHHELSQLAEKAAENRTSIYHDSLYKTNAFITEALENQLNQSSDVLRNELKAVQQNANEQAANSVSHLSEAIARTKDEIRLTVSSELTDVTNQTGQVITHVRNDLLTNIDSLDKNQQALTTSINQAMLNEQKNQQDIFKQISELKEHISELQKNALQNVLDQFSTSYKKQQQMDKTYAEKVEKKLAHFHEQVNDITTEIIHLSDNVTLLKEEQQKNKQILNELDQADNHQRLAEQITREQKVIDQKFTAMGQQLQSIQTLIHLLKSSPEKVDNVGIEETEKAGARTEKITDDANGIMVINQFKNNLLTHSDMYEKGKKVYRAFYNKNGVMTRTINYDINGKMLTEITYYPDGAVKERKERIKKHGKSQMLVTKFDQSGRKLN